MRGQLRQRVTYANVMSTLAVFVALGGSTYAATAINGRDIVRRSISAPKIKLNTLGSNEIRESTLSTVPRARRALTLAGLSAAELFNACPADTFPKAGTCIERAPRRAAAYGSAALTCSNVGQPFGRGRRLPTLAEMELALNAVDLAQGGELTADVVPSASRAGRVDVIYLAGPGEIGVVPDTIDGAKAYRCVGDPFS